MEREPRSKSEGFADSELVELLGTRLDSWNFAERSDEQNYRFAFGMAYSLTEMFDQIKFGTDKDIPGAMLPSSLEPLARQTSKYDGETFYSEGLIIRAERNDDDFIIPGKFPDISQFKNFDEIVTQINSNPELRAQITETVRIPNPIVELSLNHHPSSDWGLAFTVCENIIKLNTFGKQGKTQSACDYIITYHDKPRVLAQTVSELALLGAKHVLWARKDYHAPLSEVDPIITRAFANLDFF